MARPLLRIQNLSIHFGSEEDPVRAVDHVSFEVQRGETVILVGESGSGKSITALSAMRLLPHAARVTNGSIWLEGIDILALPEHRMRDIRGSRLGMIFQDPQSSLNPVISIGKQIGEVLKRHKGLRGRALTDRVIELLTAVEIPEPERRYGEFPHQFSGGMKQRVMIAIAMAAEPDLLIADEPTTALDVTVQAQVLELLRKQQRKTDM